jgi:transposase
MGEIVNRIVYALRGGIAWRRLPRDFPPWQTVDRWCAAWRDQGVFEKINHALVMADRERVGRDASPAAATIDSRATLVPIFYGPRAVGALGIAIAPSGPRGGDAGHLLTAGRRFADGPAGSYLGPRISPSLLARADEVGEI